MVVTILVVHRVLHVRHGRAERESTELAPTAAVLASPTRKLALFVLVAHRGRVEVATTDQVPNAVALAPTRKLALHVRHGRVELESTELAPNAAVLAPPTHKLAMLVLVAHRGRV